MLSFGSAVEVVKPHSLRERVQAEAKAIVAQNALKPGRVRADLANLALDPKFEYSLATMTANTTMKPTMDVLLCETCYKSCEGPIDIDEHDYDPDLDSGELCEICDSAICADFYRVLKVELTEEHGELIRSHICGCFFRGCAVVGDSDGDAWDDTNGTLWEAFSLEFLSDGSVYDELIARAIWDGEPDVLDLPAGLTCPECGVDLDHWYLDVKQRMTVITLHIPSDLPEDISSLPPPPDHASHIEYFRSDCSRFLVHLTRSGRICYGYENDSFEDVERDCEASEVLWAILNSGVIRANRGKGMRCPAVCFTDKPLAGLKDTLVGHEAAVRSGKALTWAPYGIMFEKNYARNLGARPVISCDASTERSLHAKDQHLVVPLTATSNWTHEREWRTGVDFKFDIAEAIVLVPTFEQAAAFERALRGANKRIKGILPLFDLFALV